MDWHCATINCCNIITILIPMLEIMKSKIFINQMMQEESSLTYGDANAFFFSSLSGIVTTGLVIGIIILIITDSSTLIGKAKAVCFTNYCRCDFLY